MTFEEYAVNASKTAIYPSRMWGVYPALGLCGEAGEVAEKVKKLFRDGEGVVTEAFREELTKEIGDVLWYVAALCFDFDISMSDAASKNLWKLASRQERGVLGGSGDNR
jgi:NTP pyrophosphatase (non-canonical NTP hydrolase)